MMIRFALAGALVCSTIAPAWAAPPALPTQSAALGHANDVAQEFTVPLVDLQLAAEGVLTGKLVTPTGEPVAGMAVVLRTAEGIEVPTTTDETGRFGYKQLRGGMYQLHTEKSATMCRVWAPGSAPPGSRNQLLMVRGEDIAAGQWAPAGIVNNTVRGFTRVMANPVAATLIVGAAVGIPVAIHNANQDDDNS